MRLWFRTFLAGMVARSPLWLCQVWRVYPIVLAIGAVLLLGLGMSVILFPNALSLYLSFAGLAVATLVETYIIVFSTRYTVAHFGPAFFRMYPAARLLSSMLPQHVFWDTLDGFQFQAPATAHAQAQFLRYVAPLAVCHSAQMALHRGRQEAYADTLKALARDSSDMPPESQLVILLFYRDVYPPVYHRIRRIRAPRMVAALTRRMVQMWRWWVPPVLGSWRLVQFSPQATPDHTLLASWPVRGRTP